MRLSFTTMATPLQSGHEAIRMARAYGYTGVDLRVSEHRGELTLHSTAQEINQIRSAFISENIMPSGLLCYNETGNDDPASWDRMTQSIVRHLDLAARLESPSIRIFGGNPRQAAIPQDYMSRSAAAIAAALQEDDSGVVVLLQNHIGSYSAKESLQLIKEAGSDRCGLVFSPDHCVLMGETLSDLYPLLQPVVRQLYIADVIKNGNEYRSTLPGKGCVPFKEAYESLGGKDFDGWITLKWEKIWHPELEEPEVALPYFIEYLNKL